MYPLFHPCDTSKDNISPSISPFACLVCSTWGSSSHVHTWTWHLGRTVPVAVKIVTTVPKWLPTGIIQFCFLFQAGHQTIPRAHTWSIPPHRPATFPKICCTRWGYAGAQRHAGTIPCGPGLSFPLVLRHAPASRAHDEIRLAQIRRSHPHNDVQVGELGPPEGHQGDHPRPPVAPRLIP